MKLRTSCFNKAIFRKDLTRFAPVGVLYTLCLIAGLMLMAAPEDSYPFWIASRMNTCIQYMSIVNLFYGPLMAALLFGDLYNSRMCNGLHAMPLRRQELFVTHIASGLTYSLVPTAVMALISLPMLGRTIVENAWQISFYWWLASNLQFVCCFGIAVFAALCAGNWLGLGVVYVGIQGGSVLVYLLRDCFCTPMLDGVSTTEWLATTLCPAFTLSKSMLELDSWSTLCRRFYGREEEMVAHFTLTDNWGSLLLWTAVGIALVGVAWLIYRKRDLESAGDPIALKALVPVVQVFASVGLGGLAAMVFQEMLPSDRRNIGYLMLFAAVSVAWFAVRMVLCRTSRVFQKRAFLGLVPVLAVLGLILGATYLDVFGVETWIPDASQVKSVQINGNYYIDATDPETIERVIRLHEIALQEEDIPYAGRYDKSLLAQGASLEEAYEAVNKADYTEEQYYLGDIFRKAIRLYIHYDFGHGLTVERQYTIWADGETEDILRQCSTDWDQFWSWNQYGQISDEEPVNIQDIDAIYIQNYNKGRYGDISAEDVASLLEALQADCVEGNLVTGALARGVFRYSYIDQETGQEKYSYDTDLYLDLACRAVAEIDGDWNMGVSFSIPADATHTIQWLQNHGYMTYEIVYAE